MADFYEEMAGVAAEMLAPASEGGLGQTGVVLIRKRTAPPDPLKPWERAEVTEELETLKAAVSGAVSSSAGGALGFGVTGFAMLATDKVVVAAVPAMDWRMDGEGVLSVSVNDQRTAVVYVEAVPEAGTPVVIKFVLREA